MAREENRFTPETGETLTRDMEREMDSLASDEGRDYDGPEDFSDPSDEEPQFRRAQRRVPVRKGPVTRKAANRLRRAAFAIIIIAALGILWMALARYGERSWRFRIESSDNIEVQGIENVSRAQVLDLMGADIGRNIFKVPLQDRKLQIEEIPWVESATVMRLLPDRIRINIKERTPVAFVRIGKKVSLIDANGVVMEMPPKSRSGYSFPVITGMQDSDPLSTRAARMHIFANLMASLDANGAGYSKDISEVQLNDPDDVKVTVEDPAGAVVIHLGADSFLERYKVFIAHVQEWRQQFAKLDSVDLRYNGQIIVNPDVAGTAPVAQKRP